MVAGVGLWGACLSAPQPRQPPDGEPFPPADTLVVRSAERVDANGDHRDDIILATVGPADQRGVYILLGTDEGIGARFHAFVNTERTPPLAVTLDQIGGDAEPDLLVLGGEDDRGHLLLYPGEPGLSFAEPLVKEVTADVKPRIDDPRAFAAVTSVDGNTEADLIFGSPYRLFVGELDEWSQLGLEDMVLHQVIGPNATQFYAARELYFFEGTGDQHPELCVVDSFETYVFVGDGTGAFAVGEGSSYFTAHPVSPFDFAAPYQIDEDGAIDIFGGFNGFLGMTSPWPVDATYQWPGDWFHLEGPVIGFEVADLDGDDAGRAELMVLEDHDVDGARLMLFENVHLDQSDPRQLVSNTSRLDFIFDGEFHPILVVPGDFNGDGDREIIAFDESGHSRCLVQLPGDELDPCP